MGLLKASYALNKALHLIPRKSRAGIITRESIRPARFYTARVIFDMPHPRERSAAGKIESAAGGIGN
jgi:hypothetical protein